LSRASRHELGLLSFAAVLRRTGVEVVYVGADLAADHWADAVVSARVQAVVLAAPTGEDVPGLRDATAAIAAADPTIAIHVGGAYQDEVGAPARPLGHRVVPAAHALAARLLTP